MDRTRTDRSRPVREHAKTEYRGPLIDVEVHLGNPNDGKIDEEFLKKLWATIQGEGVEYAFFIPTPNDGRHRHHEIGVAQNKRMVEIGQRRVRLFCCGNYITYWMHRAHDAGRYKSEEIDLLLKRLSRDLDSGEYLGVGEIATHHFKKREFQGIIRYPISFEPFLKVVDIIAQKNAWLFLHAEPIDSATGTSYENEVFGGVELIHRRQPNLKLVLAHTAMTNTINARRILDRYPNMIMSIKMQPKDNWQRLGPVVNARGNLYQDWAELFENMPERFVIGVDSKPGRGDRYPLEKYRNEIRAARRMLSTLDSKVAQAIAYRNAGRLFIRPDKGG